MADRSARARRGPWVLAAVTLVLAAVVSYQVLNWSARQVPPSSNPAARPGGRDAVGPAPPDVGLEELEAGARQAPAPGRNPFRFQPRTAGLGEAPPASQSPRTVPSAPRPADAPPRSAAAPIPLKFIGTVDAPGVGVVAALTDGTFVFHGREGDIIDGRYRIVTIGVESIVLERVPGGERQTIRLTG